ncbi:tetratricopeptide repeat protein [Saccharothrix syringae]|uniref:Tetratricopeptide repeat protein n=2 Tax=Saccharothrix syringae TaxID=103733 RepID=A0A5Q0HF87_SACSY|nr:tetratricopeptide repeat protein [Saccharothrix syringae]QFZ24513.1 tetratricopeptide repeat protein [Saccharothrix syringae]
MPGTADVVLQAGVVHGDVSLGADPLPPWSVVPRQLPAGPGLFAGRAEQLRTLDCALTAAASHDPGTATPDSDSDVASAASAMGATVLVSAIGGAGGIGKTWLALAWAHLRLERFPDGQLFVDLHGFSSAGEPVEPAVAVRGFLDALGVNPDRIPTDLDAQAALYRSLVADKRMLVVLDNAATSEQVVPLLPGSPTCTVLVTGRHRLASLIDRHGARHLSLGVLDRDEARALLTARLPDRVAADSDAVDELVSLCGGHPLALAITARTADARPAVPLAEVAAELRELGLEVLDHDTDAAASLPTVLSWSLRYLTDQHRTLFALLGIAPGPDTTTAATAALADLSLTPARRALTALEDASLLERRAGGRYAMHDLVRAYAATTAQGLPEHVRKAALVRVGDFHLHTAFTADRLLDPHSPSLPPAPPAPGVRPHPLPDPASAMVWLEAEYATLLATQRTAATLGRHQVVLHMAWALKTFHLRRGHLRDALAVWRAALDAAVHLPDPTALGRAHRTLGRVYAALFLHKDAIRHMDRALDLATRHHDHTEQAHTHRALAHAWKQKGRDRLALDHARNALDLYRTLDQPTWEADALNLVGWFTARLGDVTAARDHCHTALALFRHHHRPEGEATALDSLAFIAHRTGDHHQALDYYHQALVLHRRHANIQEVANTLDGTGHPLAALGHHDHAREVWREALQLYQDQGRDEEAARVQQELDNLDHTRCPATDSR